jgi:hypothetical protein
MSYCDSFIEKIDDIHKEFIKNMSPEEFAKMLNGILNIPKIKDKYQPELMSVTKGKEGENTFENNISRFLSSEYSIANSSKLGHAGDFIINYVSNNNMRIYKLMIDIKNYTKTVPTKEIDKMFADLNAHSDINAGLMISYNSKFTGINKSIDIQYYNSNHGVIPIVYVSISNIEIISEVIKLVFYILEQKESSNSNNINKKELLLSINDLSEQVSNITQCKTDLLETKSTIDKSLQNIVNNIIQYEISMLIKIKQINRVLTNATHKAKPFDDMIKEFDLTDRPYKYQEVLNDIFQLEWDSSTINKKKRLWTLTKAKNTISFHITKKKITFITSYKPDYDIYLVKSGNTYQLVVTIEKLPIIKKISLSA